MKKSDMRELRKVVKNQLAVEKVYCLYVDTENNVFGLHQPDPEAA